MNFLDSLSTVILFDILAVVAIIIIICSTSFTRIAIKSHDLYIVAFLSVLLIVMLVLAIMVIIALLERI